VHSLVELKTLVHSYHSEHKTWNVESQEPVYSVIGTLSL
jgi:hypothetical protein